MIEERKVNKELEDLLKEIYKDNTEWLKFSEAKNAALLAFNGVLLFGILTTINNNILSDMNTILYISAAIICVNIIILLWSFIPREKKNEGITTELSNALFYKEISNFNKNTYYKKICARYGFEKLDNAYYLDLVNQIVSISWIANIKFKYFTISTYITIIAFIIIFIKYVCLQL